MVILFGGIVLPQEYVPYEKLPVLRSGIILGQIVKNRIEPHHSAFMAAKACECVSKVDFDVNSAEIKVFLHGEEVAVDNNIKGYRIRDGKTPEYIALDASLILNVECLTQSNSPNFPWGLIPFLMMQIKND